jgi:hypothetical protein
MKPLFGVAESSNPTILMVLPGVNLTLVVKFTVKEFEALASGLD